MKSKNKYDEIQQLLFRAAEAREQFENEGLNQNYINCYKEMQAALKPRYPVVEFFKKHIIGRAEAPIMIRYNIINSKIFSLRIHKFIKSDHDCLHDHPWNFLTIILKGGYFEKLENGARPWRGPGSILYRKAEHKHAVQLKDEQPSYSLFLSLGVRRQWGFWDKGIWTHWKLFNSQNKCD